MEMRLFIAINFDDDIKEQLYQLITLLRTNTTGGSFTLKENLHLTLNFIGETNRLDMVKQAMNQVVDRIKPECFTLTFRGFGRFKRREGDIYWVGVEENLMLSSLQKELVKELKEAGFFDIDDREFKPHLTLARKITTDGQIMSKSMEESVKPMHMPITKISLMKSDRIAGKLVYTEVYQVPFTS